MLAKVISRLPREAIRNGTFTNAFDNVISRYIDKYTGRGINTRYLMCVRKGLLALQDFQKHLTPLELIEILRSACSVKGIHKDIQSALTTCVSLLTVVDISASIKESMERKLTLFHDKTKAKEHTRPKLVEAPMRTLLS